MYKKFISNVIPRNQYQHFSGLFPLWTGYLEAAENYILKPRILDDYYLLYISDGKGFFNCNNKSYEINKFDVFFLFPSVLHSYGTDKKYLMKQWWVGFNGPLTKIILNDLKVSPDSPIIKNINNPEFIYEIDKMVNSYTGINPTDFLKASGSLSKLMGIIGGSMNPPIENTVPENHKITMPIQKAVNYIEANFPYEISIEKVAEYCNLSRSRFSARFSEEMGKSPLDFLSITRLNKAKQYLAETKLTITEIANSVGMQDPQYFARFFKNNEGLTPTYYRLKCLTTE